MSCRLLSFCGHVAACLPFKRCDEPYTLLHLINSVISRRGAFVLSAQKASLESAKQAPAKPASASTAVHPQRVHASPIEEVVVPRDAEAGPRDDGAVPQDGSGAVQRGEDGRQGMGGNAEALPAEAGSGTMPGHETVDQV